MNDVLDALHVTRERLLDPDKWSRNGQELPERECLVQAMTNAASSVKCPHKASLLSDMFDVVIDVLGRDHLTAWNDDPGRTHAEVIDTIQTAIVKVEKKQEIDHL